MKTFPRSMSLLRILLFNVALLTIMLWKSELVLDPTSAQTQSRKPTRPRTGPTPSTPPSEPLPRRASANDQSVWDEAKSLDTKESYRFYLKDQEFGVYRREAELRILEIEAAEEQIVWNVALNSGTREGYVNFLESGKARNFSELALSKIIAFDQAKADRAWEDAERINTAESYSIFLGNHPFTKHSTRARIRLSSLGGNLPAEPPVIAATIGTVITNSFGMQFTWIPPGTMGTAKIEKGFWIGKFEVTQGQYEAVTGKNPSRFTACGMDCPVESIGFSSYDLSSDVDVFIKALNERGDGLEYSLPTATEWEYSARAGSTNLFVFGNSIGSSQANIWGDAPFGIAPKGPSMRATVKVGGYAPNAWGLFDVHGNVYEMTRTLRDQSNNYILRLHGGAWTSAGSWATFSGSFGDISDEEIQRSIATSRRESFKDLDYNQKQILRSRSGIVGLRLVARVIEPQNQKPPSNNRR